MGLALPGKPLSTATLLDRLDRNYGIEISRRGAAIAHKLGIQHRHMARDFKAVHEIARAGHSNAELSALALRGALTQAKMQPDQLGYLISHTTTPDTLLPPNIAWVADKLNFSGPFAEFRQACTGFANALVMAAGLLFQPNSKPIAIVGSETGSVFCDPRRAVHDPAQLVNLMQMGDAAAAIILAPYDDAGDCIDCFAFGNLGQHQQPGLSLINGGAQQPFTEHDIMEFAHDYQSISATGQKLFEAGYAAAAHMGSEPAKADFLIPHQANGRLDELLAPALNMPHERIVTSARHMGNTGSAAIWAALYETRQKLAAGGKAVILGAEATKHMFATFRYTHSSCTT